jgi:hypothetical protein
MTISGFDVALRADYLVQNTVSGNTEDCDMLIDASLFGEPLRQFDEDAPVAGVPDFVESNDQP